MKTIQSLLTIAQMSHTPMGIEQELMIISSLQNLSNTEIKADLQSFYSILNLLYESHGYDYVIGGEGSMGNEGFISYVNKYNEFVWAYFFDFCNPIEKITIENHFLICISNNQIRLHINLHELTDVKIDYLKK